MSNPLTTCLQRLHHGGFGLIDTLIALTLLAISLLGISGGVHYALRTAHATLLQTQAIDLVADLAEDLHSVAPDQVHALLSGWQARVQLSLPTRDFDPPRVARAELARGDAEPMAWFDVDIGWKGVSGAPDGSLLLPVTSPGSEALP
jgi:Tfp pilus assembly protein PilV